MRISSKGRYALAAAIVIAANKNLNGTISATDIVERLGISKIYLEQILVLLKKGGILNSSKGSKGGHTLTRPASQITTCDILYTVEASLTEKNDEPSCTNSPIIDDTIKSLVFDPLDDVVEKFLTSITLQELVDLFDTYTDNQVFMFHI